MDIFESLENLNVSEECFDEIIESITKMVAPILAGKDKHGREESIGTKIDRASHKHPYIMKASSAVDNAINKVRNIGQQKDNRTPEEKLRNVKPAGTIYGKDMYSNAQLKDAAYKMSESLYNEIMGIVEAILNEKEYIVTAPKYASDHYAPTTGTKYAKALDAKAQELADASNREGKSAEEIGDRRGYGKGSVAPTEKSSLDSIKAAARRKFGNDASGKRKATKAIKTQFPDFKRPKASDHITIFGNKFKHLTY